MTDQPPPPQDGRVLGLIKAAQGLTFTNLLVLAGLAGIAIPVYVVYRALGDDALLDRLMSTYEVIDSYEGCLVRHVQERGGPDLWGVSSGFAFQGEARYYVNVIVETLPTDDEVASYCAVLKLIADRLVERDGEVQRGPLPGTAPDGGGHDGDMPGTPTPEEEN
jgi:hypothetical protein